jgi:predicted deacylase
MLLLITGGLVLLLTITIPLEHWLLVKMLGTPTPSAVIASDKIMLLTPTPQPDSAEITVNTVTVTATQTLEIPATQTPAPTSTAPPTAEPAPVNLETPPAPEVSTIGYSVAGRALEVFAFGSGADKRMIIAGIHGGYEWNTIALADELITYITEHVDIIPPDIRLYILRNMNPDGEARDHWLDGRANENGVDLNRNFPALWVPGYGKPGCWNYRQLSSGVSPGSEPETAAVMNFILENQISALISYHSAALGIFPGGQPPDPVSKSLAKAVSQVSNYAYPPVNNGCEYHGQLIDWASMNNIAAVDIELTNHSDTDFKQNLRILEVFLNWIYEE